MERIKTLPKIEFTGITVGLRFHVAVLYLAKELHNTLSWILQYFVKKQVWPST